MTETQPIVSVAGLRGLVGSSFTPEVIFPYVAAFADMLERPCAVVGGDSRPSRVVWAQSLVESILRARGIDVLAVGLVPTPTLGMMVREFGAGGGIAITASHNPIEWNGLKFFHAAGEFLTSAHHRTLHELLETSGDRPPVCRVGNRERRTDAIEIHLAQVMRRLGDEAAASGVPVGTPRVVLDCCNGAGSELGPRVARALGADVHVLFDDPSAPFPRVAEPLPENLGALCDEVRRRGAAFGAALDPDADRLALVDESGRAIGEERTLVLAADEFLHRARAGGKIDAMGPIVVNLSTSMAIEAVAAKYGRPTARTKIGEAHVLAGMRKTGAAIGGEGNGGVILPAVHPGRDAATALALIVGGLQRRGGTLSAWNAEFPDYVLLKAKIERGTISVDEALARTREAFADATAIDTTDGFKASYEGQWVHVRPSGTEPILRLFAEAPTAGAAEALLERARGAIARS